MKSLKLKPIYFFIFTFLFLIILQSQSRTNLPDGFRKMRLGMTLDSAKNVLIEDNYFAYRGDPDVSMLDSENKSSIECAGRTYIENAYFQFDDQKLYIIIFDLDRTALDYYTVFTTLKEKYGEPLSLNPSLAIWEDGDTRISVEKPLSVKYLKMDVFDSLVDKEREELNLMEFSVQNFLSEF